MLGRLSPQLMSLLQATVSLSVLGTTTSRMQKRRHCLIVVNLNILLTLQLKRLLIRLSLVLILTLIY